jgi:hypothetical protein
MFIYLIIACDKIQNFQKEIKRTLEMDQGNCLTFDAFVEWLEH